MAGLKRKEAPKTGAVKASLPQKKQKTAPVKAAAPKSKSKSIPVGEDSPESDTTEDDEFDDLSSEDGAAAQGDDSMSDVDSAPETSKASKTNGSADVNGTEPEKKMKSMSGFWNESKQSLTWRQLVQPLPKPMLPSEPLQRSAKRTSPMPTLFNDPRRYGSV